MRVPIWHLLLLLPVGCAAQNSAGPALHDESSDDAITSEDVIEVTCADDIAAVGAGGLSAARTTITTSEADSQRLITASADVMTLYTDEDDGLHISVETALLDEIFLLTYARPAGSDDDWRRVRIPTSHFEVPYLLGSADQREALDGRQSGIEASADLDFLYSMRIARDVRVYDDPDDLGTSDSHVTDGVWVRGMATRQNVSVGDNLTFVGSKRLFVSFDSIPALADIAHQPLEWAFLGVPIKTWVPFDGLAGEYEFEFDASCPSECYELETTRSCGFGEI